MIVSKNIVLGALSGALAATAVLIVANAVTPSRAKSPAVHPLVRAQLDASAGIVTGDAAADGQVVRSTVRPKDQSSLMAPAPSAASPN